MSQKAKKSKKLQAKLNKQQTKRLVPFFKKFNSMAKIMIRSITSQIEMEKKSIQKINMMITTMKIPTSELQRTMDIHLVDLKKTSVKSKGSLGYNQVLDWEKKMGKRSKGLIL